MRYLVIDGDLDGSSDLPPLSHPAVLSIALGYDEAAQRMHDHLAGADGSSVIDILDGQGANGDEIHGVRGSMTLYRAMPMPEDDMPEIAENDLLAGFFLVSSHSDESETCYTTYVRQIGRGILCVSIVGCWGNPTSTLADISLLDQTAGRRTPLGRLVLDDPHSSIDRSNSTIVPLPADTDDLSVDIALLRAALELAAA
jgi:hypothetical protein